MKFSVRIFSLLLAVILLAGILPVHVFAAGKPIMYGIGFVNTDNLKLRQSASTSSPIVDIANKDDCVVVVSKVGSWYKVIYNLQEGYMYGIYLDVLTRENAELGYGRVTGDKVNVRQGAGTGYRAVGLATKGDMAYIIGLNSGWYKIIFNDRISYIRSDYMELTEIPYENEDSEKEPLFFRKGRSTGTVPSADALKPAPTEPKPTEPAPTEPKPTEPAPTEPKPTEPKPTEPAPTEPKPTEPKPTEPKPTEPAPTEPKPTEPETTKPQLIYGAGFVTASGGLRLRAQATTNSAILDTAQRNEVVVVLSKEGDWYKVNYNLQEGYMHSDYVSVLTRENAELGYGQFLENSKVYTAVDPTSKVLDTANKDEKAYIIGVNTGWYKVIFKDAIGYVPSNVLKLTEVPYENHDSENYPRFFRLGKSTGLAPSADALKEEVLIPSTDGEKIVATAKKYLGVPYVWGGASPSGFDCSGLVYYVFKVNGYSMYRTPEDQYRQGTYVSRNNLQPGDVVFFYNTVPGTGISHVGIYIGDGQFIHSPNSRSVVSIARLDNTYWNQHYYGARRMSK